MDLKQPFQMIIFFSIQTFLWTSCTPWNRNIIYLILWTAMSSGVRCSGVTGTKRVAQISWRRKRRVRASAVVGAPTVSLLRLQPRGPTSGSGGHLGRTSHAHHRVQVGTVGQAAGALLVNEEGVHPEVEQFPTVDIPRPGKWGTFINLTKISNGKLISRFATYNVEIVLETWMNLAVMVAVKMCRKGENLVNYQCQWISIAKTKLN